MMFFRCKQQVIACTVNSNYVNAEYNAMLGRNVNTHFIWHFEINNCYCCKVCAACCYVTTTTVASIHVFSATIIVALVTVAGAGDYLTG